MGSKAHVLRSAPGWRGALWIQVPHGAAPHNRKSRTMNCKWIASLTLVATALTLGTSAFAQSGSNPVIQNDVAKLKTDKAAARAAHDKLHADKQVLKADKAAGNTGAVATDKATVATDKQALKADKKLVHADKKLVQTKAPA